MVHMAKFTLKLSGSYDYYIYEKHKQFLAYLSTLIWNKWCFFDQFVWHFSLPDSYLVGILHDILIDKDLPTTKHRGQNKTHTNWFKQKPCANRDIKNHTLLRHFWSLALLMLLMAEFWLHYLEYILKNPSLQWDQIAKLNWCNQWISDEPNGTLALWLPKKGVHGGMPHKNLACQSTCTCPCDFYMYTQHYLYNE